MDQQKIILKFNAFYVSRKPISMFLTTFNYSVNRAPARWINRKIIIVFSSPIQIKEVLPFDFRQKDSWDFGTGLGPLADITTVRDSLRARRDLGVTGSVGLARFTCPFCSSSLARIKGENGRKNRRK
jgi:hypothetical protein